MSIGEKNIITRKNKEREKVMQELQIVSLENTDIVGWDFEQIKSQLEQRLEYYKNLVYTEDDIKSAKNDRSDLNKAKTVIENARKAYKAKCMEPYEALEPKIKELVGMIENQRHLIDDTVKSFEDKKKKEKKVEIRSYYDKKSFVLGEYADRLYDKLLDPKWLNATTAKGKYEEEIQIAVNNALNDINSIKATNSPFVDTLIDVYIDTLSMERVETKNAELTEAHSKAKFVETQVSEPEQPAGEIRNLVSQTSSADGSNMIKVYATKSQLVQITDFMKAIGVTYEIV